jgi:peptidoglycan biosynthesis protein MviN/MurJ (putative lipid II flippase)
MLTRVGTAAERDAVRVHDARIFRGAMWSLGFVVAAKAAGAAKEIAVAAVYGTGAPVDAYLFLFRIFDLPGSVWLGTLGVTFVPLFFLLRDSRADFDRFRSELAGVSIVAGIVLGLVASILMPLAVNAGWTGLPPDVAQLAAGMAAPLALVLPLGIVSGVIFARMIAAERRSVNLIDGVPSAVLLMALLAFPTGATGPLVWGTVAGYAVALLALVLMQGRVERIPRPVLSFSSPMWGEFTRFTVIVGASGFIFGLTVVIDQWMVASLGPSAIATLGYATRLLALATAIGATAITRVMLPVLADIETSHSATARRVATRWAIVFFLCGVVAIAIGWVLAPFAIRIMFERGAFTPEDTAAVAEVLRFGLFQLPFVFAGAIFAQLWAARRNYVALLWINIVVVAVKVTANLALIGPFGINGAMLGSAAMYAASLAILWGLARNQDGRANPAPV